MDERWLPLIPTISVGATDGRFLTNASIPTYGVSGMLRDADGGGVHGPHRLVMKFWGEWQL